LLIASVNAELYNNHINYDRVAIYAYVLLSSNVYAYRCNDGWAICIVAAVFYYSFWLQFLTPVFDRSSVRRCTWSQSLSLLKVTNVVKIPFILHVMNILQSI
jgi:hypothetical protein